MGVTIPYPIDLRVIEIKPQPLGAMAGHGINYFTSKIEIKPQQCWGSLHFPQHYFTSK